MAPRARRSFSAQFKAETVELIRSSGKAIGQVCRDLDLTETAVRRWVQQAEIDAGQRPGLTTAERAELAELRRENRILREEREILKKLGQQAWLDGSWSWAIACASRFGELMCEGGEDGATTGSAEGDGGAAAGAESGSLLELRRGPLGGVPQPASADVPV